MFSQAAAQRIKHRNNPGRRYNGQVSARVLFVFAFAASPLAGQTVRSYPVVGQAFGNAPASSTPATTSTPSFRIQCLANTFGSSLTVPLAVPRAYLRPDQKSCTATDIICAPVSPVSFTGHSTSIAHGRGGQYDVYRRDGAADRVSAARSAYTTVQDSHSGGRARMTDSPDPANSNLAHRPLRFLRPQPPQERSRG